ncbi:MAG: hypothetical protein WCA22_07285 [Candidatus Binatus sp.]
MAKRRYTAEKIVPVLGQGWKWQSRERQGNASGLPRGLRAAAVGGEVIKGAGRNAVVVSLRSLGRTSA